MSSKFRYLKNNLYSLVGKDLAPIFGGEGKFRDVYRIVGDIKDVKSYQGCVIKYAKNDVGKLQNMREFQTWQAVRNKDYKELFCPIENKSPGNNFVIMDYAKPQTYSTRECYNMKSEIKRKTRISRYEIPDHNFDIHSGNLAYYPPYGRTVVIDYSWGADFEFNY